MSLAEDKSDRDSFLKAHDRDKLRSHIAEANLQTKWHLDQNKNTQFLSKNEHELFNQFQDSIGVSTNAITKQGHEGVSNSIDNINASVGSRITINTQKSGYGYPYQWKQQYSARLKGASPGDANIVHQNAIKNIF